MKLKIEKDILLESLAITAKAISTKNLIPVLAGIKFELDQRGLYLLGSDNDISIKTFIPSSKITEIKETGSIIIPGKYIVDIIRKLPNDLIHIEVMDGSKIIIRSLKSEFVINGIEGSEYPNLDMKENKAPILLDRKLFRDIINETSFAASTDESRPILTGINLKFSSNTMECIATDSYRLAKKIVTLDNSVENDINIVIPSKNLNELKNLFADNENPMELHLFDNKVLFKFDEILFQSRLLNGTYPETSKLIPEDFELVVTAKLNDVYTTIDRASLLNTERDKNIIKFESRENDAVISSNAPEIGKVEEVITISKNNDHNIIISFVSRYMIEAIKTFKDTELMICFNGEAKPIIIKSVKDSSLIQLVLPIRTY